MVVLAALVAGGAFIFTRDGNISEDAVKEVATSAAKVAADKGMEAVDEGKEQVMEKGKEAIDGAVEKVVEEGKDAVGTAVKEVGDKMINEEEVVADSEGMGSFEDYAPEKIAASGGAVIDFAADWCPSCRAFEKDVLENADQIPAGLTILKADYDEETELKKKYGVTQQHTFVQVDADGNEIAKWQASPTLSAFLTKVQ